MVLIVLGSASCVFLAVNRGPPRIKCGPNIGLMLVCDAGPTLRECNVIVGGLGYGGGCSPVD